MFCAHKLGQLQERAAPSAGTVFGSADLDVHCSVHLPERGTLVNIAISAFANVAECGAALGLDLSTALLILPSNFESAVSRSDLVQDSSTSWLSDRFTEARIPHTVLLPDRETQRRSMSQSDRFRSRMAGTAELPLVCATPRFALQTFDVFSLVVGYVFDAAQMARGEATDATHVDLVIGPRSGRYVRISYQGPVTEVQAVAATIRKLLQQEQV
ncbi:hypothetical protein EPN42_02375 [bacterium]|nr:MAG: hypothetical protein EPN42_02375 [bacterium]